MIRSSYILFAIFSFAVLMSGCGGSSSGTNTVKSGANSNTTTSGPSNQAAPGIPNDPTQANISANAPPQGNIDLKDKRKLTDSNPNGPIPQPQRSPAPENSEFATTMDRQGHFIEERFFKDNPVLVKAERTWLAPGSSKVKLTLKNGRAATIDGARVDILSTIPSATLLSLAGIKAPAAKPVPEQTRVTLTIPLRPDQVKPPH